VDFTITAEAEKFGSRFKEDIELLLEDGNDQFLHLLAKKRDDWPDGIKDWADEHVRRFLDWALGPLGGHHGILKMKNKDGYTPFHVAIIRQHTLFVDAILENPKLINLGFVFAMECQWGNSLHVGIKYGLDLKS
jgi:hypothetical protein